MALENRRVCRAPSAVSGAAVAWRRVHFRQDHSAACRAGVRRHHPVHSLCAAAGPPRRQCHLRGAAGAAAAAVAARGHRGHCLRRAASGIRPALSLAQPSACIRDATRDDPGRGSISRCVRGALRILARAFAGRRGRAPDLSGPARRLTRTTATARYRWRGSPHGSRRRRCHASAFRASCGTPIARCCGACRT